MRPTSSDKAREWAIGAVALKPATIAGSGEAKVYYYHNDHLGTPKALTDETQAVVWRADFTPFGSVLETVATVDNPLRFPGQYFDQETGLYYNYFRGYDPGTGRYFESDPIGLIGGLNTYSYVENNPVRYGDPFGLIIPGDPDPTDEILIIMGLKKLWDLYRGVKGAKSAAQLAKHLKNLQKAKKQLEDLKKTCPPGKTAQDKWKEAIRELERQIKGHEKEIRQKWPEALE